MRTPHPELSPTLRTRRRRVLPGFGLTLGTTLLFLSLIVLLPLSAAFIRTAGLSWEEFWGHVSSPRVVASDRLTFGAALAAAAANAIFGIMLIEDTRAPGIPVLPKGATGMGADLWVFQPPQ